MGAHTGWSLLRIWVGKARWSNSPTWDEGLEEFTFTRARHSLNISINLACSRRAESKDQPKSACHNVGLLLRVYRRKHNLAARS